jgi:hypothetical protein
MATLNTIRPKNTAYTKEFLNFEWARKAMIAFHDAEYAILITTYNWDNNVSRLARARNDTIVAHGMLPVSPDDAEECLTVSAQILPVFLPDGDSLIAKYPFRPEKIQEIASVLYPAS